MLRMWISLQAAALGLLIANLIHYSHVQAAQLSLPPFWSFSPDLSFPSSSSLLNSYSDLAPFSLFAPILSSTSFDAGSKGFSLGFLSLFDSSSSSPSQIYFSICLGASKDGAGNAPFLVPVWTLNNNTPLEQQGQERLVKLGVNANKELLLADGDGNVVWNVSNVESMDMQDNGNLVIYDSNNNTVWQSFDHPRDTLLQGQKLRLEMEIASSNLVYKGVMQPGGILIYLNVATPWPLAYWTIPANKTVYDYFESEINPFLLGSNASISFTSSLAALNCGQPDTSQAYAMVEGEYIKVQGVCADLNFSVYYGEMDLLRLDDDGYVRDYLLQLDNSSYNFTSSSANYMPCFTPNVCGAYGICSTSNLGNNTEHNCRCPSDVDNKNLSNAFTFIDASNPSQGCQRTVPLECDPEPAAQSLSEIKNVAFMSMPYLYELTWRDSRIPLEDCMAACSSNCSCSGIFYEKTVSYCLPFGDNTAMSNLSLLSVPLTDYSAYVKIQFSSDKSSPSRVKKFLPAIVAVASFMLAVLAAFIAVVMYRKWKQERVDPESRLAEEQLLGALPSLPTRYTYDELSRFTKGFSKLVGSGGFGSVYEGVLPDARRVAVKKLEVRSQGHKEFLAEIATMGGISHLNIVRLYGFCLERRDRLLVYEYMHNESLDKWLFCKEGTDQVMSWQTRFNVALGTARGLAYLHEECPNPILHFDVKPQNILLDEEFNAKLADFGLSKLVARGASSQVMTVVRGTPGYMAPEWLSHSVVSKKCDVYSFGMVLLELVSGRRNVEASLIGTEEYYFPKWAVKKSREGNVGEMVDKRLLQGAGLVDGDEEQVKRVVGVALLCIHGDPDLRPSMTVVCNILDGSATLPKEALDSISLVDVKPPSITTLMNSSSGGLLINNRSSDIKPR